MGETEPIADLFESIAAEFDVAMGRPARVSEDCARIRDWLDRPPTAPRLERLRQLLPLLRKRLGPIVVPLFDLLEEAAAASADPWPFLDGMLASRDDDLSRRALALAERLAVSGSLAIDRRLVQCLAERTEAQGSPLGEPVALATIARILVARGRALHGSPSGLAASRAGPEPQDPVLALYLEESQGRVRRLAARLLDLDGQPVPPTLAERLLGSEAHAFLCPYLRYTRAGHLDLLQLVPEPGRPPPALAALRRAEAACGESLLREVIAELGWARVNLGVEVRQLCGVSIGGSLPLMLSPAEAPLFELADQARRTAELHLIVAHGGLPAEGGEASSAGVVGRFRAYNLAHAEALAEILDLAPLTREKVERILERMDRIVDDFVALFASFSEECAILPGLYRELRGRVVSELREEGAAAQLSAELTRLVQSFEDPRTLGEVRTLHGLKRYLHQRGLRLGFRLVGAGGATNRTVDLVLASPRRAVQAVRKISYVDFEPQTELAVPYPVALVADGFARQLIHGQESFPSVQVFCYGNEVHYYLAFRNHPALLRIDYAPPLLGGMIDLEYYGVSVYEQSVHPNPSLDALRLFFRRLEFDLKLEGTHIHARYDKERALDLGDVCEKAELLCCLVPHLMDVDWTIGSLNLDAEARLAVAEAWSESFAEWGVLPVRQLLTKDRRGILLGLESGPAGEREVAWSAGTPYRDRFRAPPPAGFMAGLHASMAELGLELAPLLEEDERRLIGQIRLERRFLRPLRAALASGQLVATPEGPRARPPELFEPRHEAESFAEILDSTDVASAARLARLVAPLERTLRFRSTGRVNGYDVQRAILALRGESLGLFVLRDAGGIVRLALFARGGVLCRRRKDPGAPWEASWSVDPAELLALLRRNSCLSPGTESSVEGREEAAAEVREAFARANPLPGPRPLPGERVLQGFRASPGRAVGTALFGTAGRTPEELDGVVLVAPSVRPEDNTFLYRSAGIVSTGGGILSHAGLIAIQFRKPALIVSGQWRREADGSLTLLYRTPEFREETRELRRCQVSVYRDWREREHRLREGDLLVLDAVEGTLRVLGQERDALALHEGFRLFGEAGRRLAGAADEAEILALRGRRLRAAHQVRKLLGRLTDPVLARHAAHELLVGDVLSGAAARREERTKLLCLLLLNHSVGETTRESLVELMRELVRRHDARADEARRRIPTASPYEALARRLEALHLRQAVQGAAASLRECGIEPPASEACGTADLDGLAVYRLEQLRAELVLSLRNAAAAPALDPRTRHLLRQVERLDLVLGRPESEELRLARARLAREDDTARRRLSGRRVVAAEDGGFELHSHLGWKAANLAEVQRLAGGDLVPPWFVVTDAAFQGVLDATLDRLAAGVEVVSPGASTLREAIGAILARGDLDNAVKSARIRDLWDGVRLPDELQEEVVAAYRRLGEVPGAARSEEGSAGPFVAIRSSAREEDAEIAARAGEFETFLFVRGEQRLLEFLKRAWAGLWTERAIHNRALLGTGAERTGGGVVVQRIVSSRVSGVLQTVNVAEGELREMVVNAGLGLGEGIVSGSVAADHVVVAKGGDLETGPLRFRYLTGDKREQVVFDRRAGLGTVRAECLYHQRLRPALEYVELCELVRVAARLEAAYGYPLDIEFGIEGARLFILQARPVATFLSALRETMQRFPLAAADARALAPT